MSHELKNSFLVDMQDALSDIAEIANCGDPERARECGFVDAYQIFTEAKGETKKQILSDPRAVVWIETLQRDLALHGLEYLAGPAWYEALLGFGKFALAVGAIEKRRVSARVASGPNQFAVPGTSTFLFTWSSLPYLDLHIDSHAKILSSVGKVEIRDLPCVSNFRIALPEAALAPPRRLERLLTILEIESNDWVGSVRQAADILALDQRSFDLASTFGTHIVPIKDDRPDVHCSVSFDAMPSAIFTSWCSDPRILAETLVHESDHQKVYLLTRHLNFWADDKCNDLAIYRSPWRDDPRPLDGLLRGASAFVRVADLWRQVLNVDACSKVEAEWAGRRAALTVYQAMDAIITIRRFGRLSEEGDKYVSMLSREVKTIYSALKEHVQFQRWFAYAGQTQNLHDQGWIETNQSLAADVINRIDEGAIMSESF